MQLHEKDWIMRVIENFVRFIAKVLLKKDNAVYEIADINHLTPGDALYRHIGALLAGGDIGAAENALFDAMAPGDIDWLWVAADFYEKLNRLDDAALERGNFSREEIESGLRDAVKAYGASLPEYQPLQI